jgi:hypothetical protein
LFHSVWPLRPISGAKVDIIPFTLISACSFDCRLCSKVFSGVSICSKPFRFVQITSQRPAKMRAPVSILTSVITLIHFSLHTDVTVLRCYGVSASPCPFSRRSLATSITPSQSFFFENRSLCILNNCRHCFITSCRR